MRSPPSTKQPEDGLTGEMNESSFQNNGSDDHDDCDAYRSDRCLTTFRIGLLNTAGQIAEHIDGSELANVFKINPFCICHQVADDAKIKSDQAKCDGNSTASSKEIKPPMIPIECDEFLIHAAHIGISRSNLLWPTVIVSCYFIDQSSVEFVQHKSSWLTSCV